jgi:P22 coat protein - gene protein 5
MANTFITPSVIARTGLATLYNTIVLAGLVWRDFDSDFSGKQGDTITIRKPATFDVEEFDRSKGITLQDVVEDSTDVKLDTIANVSFPVTDEQMTLEIDDFQGRLLNPAMEAIAQKVDGDLANALVAAAESEGQLAAKGGEPANFAFRGARTILSRNNLPVTGRVAVLSPEGISVSLGDPLLIKANESGSTDALREANIGRLLGLDTYESQTFGAGPGPRGSADGVAFHRTAVTLATRPLQAPRGVAASQVEIASFRGLSLRVVYAYNNTFKQDEISLDMLYGIADTRPEAAVELDFGQGS